MMGLLASLFGVLLEGLASLSQNAEPGSGDRGQQMDPDG